MTLIEKVTEDVQVFLGQQKNGPFMNERDLQMHLAIALKNSSNNYDNVEVEYYVPLMEADQNGNEFKVLGEDYVWNKDMRVDIVVKKDGKFIPIELKYKTKEINKDIPRFGEVLEGVTIIKNQAAQNEAKYGFWKDVRRIELLKRRFKSVPGGLAIFLTNDQYYQNETNEDAMSYTHSIAERVHDKVREEIHKKKQKGPRKEFPEFELDKEHKIKWSNPLVNPNQFEYILLQV